VRSLGRVRPLEFPATRDELRKDLDAIREEAARRDRGPASPDALAAERASIRPGESDDEDEDEDEEKARATDAGLEERFRAGSE
jgi:hypothetical protein